MLDSIQNRLLITTTCVLVVFLTIVGWVLDRSHTDSVVTGAEEQLRLVIYSMMGSIQEVDGRLHFDRGLSEPRLTQPDSSLYAQVSNEAGDKIWISPSAVTTGVAILPVNLQPGLFEFRPQILPRSALNTTAVWCRGP